MSVQIIVKDGRPEWAVLPFEEYEALLAKLEAFEAGGLDVSEAQQEPPLATASETVSDVDRQKLRSNMMEQLQNTAKVSQEGSFSGTKTAAIRAKKGLDIALLARDIGISPVYLAQIEAGERQPSEPILRNIARALDVDVQALSGVDGA